MSITCNYTGNAGSYSHLTWKQMLSNSGGNFDEKNGRAPPTSCVYSVQCTVYSVIVQIVIPFNVYLDDYNIQV